MAGCLPGLGRLKAGRRFRGLCGRGGRPSGVGNDRILSVPLDQPAEKQMIGVAMAIACLRTVKGALRGRLINGIISSETMPELLLQTQTPASQSVGTRLPKYFPGLPNRSRHLETVPQMGCGP